MSQRPLLRHIPELRYLLRLWGRALTLYIVLRSLAVVGNANADRVLGAATGSRWDLDWRALLVLFAMVIGFVWVFARRQRELVLLRNLGVDTRVLLAVAVVPTLVLETVIQWWLA